MILDRQPLNLKEVKDIVDNTSDNEKKAQIEIYLKKFLKTKSGRAEKIKQGLLELDLLKIKNEHIVKIIDLIPEDASDLNKIFTEVSLTEDETNKILEIIKNSK